MKAFRNDNMLKKYSKIILLLCMPFIFLNYCIQAAHEDVNTAKYIKFQEAMDNREDSNAISVGEIILTQLEQKYPTDSGMRAFKLKYDTAISLAEQMQEQLKKVESIKMSSVDNILVSNDESIPITSAKSYYDSASRVFSMPVNVNNLTDEEKSFLLQFYNLVLNNLTNNIAQAGRALSLSDSRFEITHDYVLVLLLLHASEQKPVNIDALPEWMKQPEHLNILANSCLLLFGQPYYAMNIAKSSAQLQGKTFSELDFYKSSAEKCGATYSNIAAECLERAIVYAKEHEPESVVNVKFLLLQLWLDSENYPLVAGEARNIFEEYPEHEKAAKAVWMYYYALSRSGNTKEIIAEIDTAINDDRYSSYKSRLLYIKWGALRRQGTQPERVAILEYELLKEYSDDPMIAPIMLSRASDMLAGKDSSGGIDLLNQILEKFPTTAAATNARRILNTLAVNN